MARESAKERDLETAGMGVDTFTPHSPEGRLDWFER